MINMRKLRLCVVVLLFTFEASLGNIYSLPAKAKQKPDTNPRGEDNLRAKREHNIYSFQFDKDVKVSNQGFPTITMSIDSAKEHSDYGHKQADYGHKQVIVMDKKPSDRYPVFLMQPVYLMNQPSLPTIGLGQSAMSNHHRIMQRPSMVRPVTRANNFDMGFGYGPRLYPQSYATQTDPYRQYVPQNHMFSAQNNFQNHAMIPNDNYASNGFSNGAGVNFMRPNGQSYQNPKPVFNPPMYSAHSGNAMSGMQSSQHGNQGHVATTQKANYGTTQEHGTIKSPPSENNLVYQSGFSPKDPGNEKKAAEHEDKKEVYKETVKPVAKFNMEIYKHPENTRINFNSQPKETIQRHLRPYESRGQYKRRRPMRRRYHRRPMYRRRRRMYFGRRSRG